MKQKTIMQVLPSLKQGGVEVGTVEIATALQKARMPNIVVSSGGPMVELLKKIGVKHITLPVQTKNPFKIWMNAKKLAKIAKQNDVALMHVRSRAPAWSVWLASRKTGIPFISSYHGIYGIKPAIKKLYNRVMLKGLCTIAVSDYVKQHLISVYHYPENKIHVIHRGADLKRFDPDKISQKQLDEFTTKYQIPTEKPIIMLVARLSKPKGQLELLQALNKMKHHEVTCLLIGGKATPQYQEELNNLIKKLPDETSLKIISLPGDQMPLAYATADIVVSTSLIPEAFGRTITEANAMHKIVIAFNHGGPVETIVDGKTGFLTPVGNIPALAKALDKVLDMSPAQKKKMEQAAAQNTYNHFSIQTMCEKTLKLYKEILK
ncbi:MAG: glycosyltransferase family 4 protein [Alphaproteobacteria bacterium]|nr:glycosyltransferase family 4 protein [Alphaproteobacteria bacterium]